MADALLNGGDGHGDGDIFVYTGGRAPNDVRRVRIAENVDTIVMGAFSHCGQLIEVEGHNKIKKIEKSAFYFCVSLRWVSDMRGVNEIEEGAFFHCVSLGDLELGKLEIIGNSVFPFCNSLRSINLSSVRRVGICAFQGCERLTEAVFGEDLGRIDEHAFCECPSLRRIAIPLKDGLIVEDDEFDDGGNPFMLCESLVRVDVIGGSHETISSLHLESWKNEMNAEITRINQTLPGTRSAKKPAAIRQWIRSVIDRREHYKSEHQELLKDAMTLLELALWKANLEENDVDLEGVRVTRRQVKRARKERCITSGAGIIIKNVLPFLELDE